MFCTVSFCAHCPAVKCLPVEEVFPLGPSLVVVGLPAIARATAGRRLGQRGAGREEGGLPQDGFAAGSPLEIEHPPVS